MLSLTFDAVRRRAVQALRAQGISSGEVDARLLLMAACGCSRADLIMRAHEDLSHEQLESFQTMLARRLADEPIAYILGQKEFWSLSFKVSEDVLIPRPETEGLVSRALDLIQDITKPHIVDVGTGSGAVLVSILREREDARAVGVDISKSALRMAKDNAQALGVDSRAQFLRSDFLASVDGKFDILVSNPPYITDQAMQELPSDVKDYEPDLALRGGKSGLLAYEEIIGQARRVLKPQAYVVFEIGFDQAQGLGLLLREHGFADIKTFQDLAGHDRVVSAKKL